MKRFVLRNTSFAQRDLLLPEAESEKMLLQDVVQVAHNEVSSSAAMRAFGCRAVMRFCCRLHGAELHEAEVCKTDQANEISVDVPNRSHANGDGQQEVALEQWAPCWKLERPQPIAIGGCGNSYKRSGRLLPCRNSAGRGLGPSETIGHTQRGRRTQKVMSPIGKNSDIV